MSATLKPRTQTVVLFQGDDMERHEVLMEALAEAATKVGSGRLGDESPATIAAREYDEFVAEASDRAVTVVVTALGRKVWRDLLNAHPPREGNESDAAYGFNEETLPDSLLPAALIEPTFDTDEDRDAFLDSLSHGQFIKLYSAAYRINADLGPSPKADASSRLARIFGETSESPEA